MPIDSILNGLWLKKYFKIQKLFLFNLVY